MTSTEAKIYHSDSDNTLSDALGTETLEARSIIPEAFQQLPDDKATPSWVWINGRQFLKVDNAAVAGFSTTPAMRYVKREVFVFYAVILRLIIPAFIPFLLRTNQVTGFGL
jgi:hypothetical protein